MQRIKLTRDEKIFNGVGYILLTGITLICVLPFLLVVSASFTREDVIYTHGYRFIPPEFSTKAYEVLLRFPDRIANAYAVSIFVTVVGTLNGLLLTSMAAYVLARKDFAYRHAFAMFFYFTMLFGGGLIPSYIWIVRYLQLKNSIWVLILPGGITAMHIFLLRNFMMSIPDSIMESAKMDGADDFLIYWKIALPLAVPGLVTIGLFKALAYWNNWVNARLYITKEGLYPLQYFLYNTLNMARFMENMAGEIGVNLPELPSETMKMATAVITTGPILLAYPFAQKYFIKGLMIGSVKG